MRWRRRVRDLIDHTASAVGVLPWFERSGARRLTVLMYHRVLSQDDCRGYPFPSIVMPESMFVAQLDWLAEHAASGPLSEMLERRGGEGRPRIAITFDDGYWDNFEMAAPLLEERGLRATFFVTSDFVGHGGLMWYDRAVLSVRARSDRELSSAAAEVGVQLPEVRALSHDRVGAWVDALKRCGPTERALFLESVEAGADERGLFRPMTAAQVAELSRRGHEIGAHSMSHEILTLLDDSALQREVEGSRDALRAWCGQAPKGFCYPNGSLDGRVVSAVRSAGYSYACTTEPPGRGAEEPLRMPRIDVTRDAVCDARGVFDPTALRAELAGLHEVFR